MIDRKTFSKLCTQAIEKTRNEISIRNQVSGYLKYQKAIKNGYFITARECMLSEQLYIKKKYKLQAQHEIIKYIKMGSCEELAEYVSFEILAHLKKLGINAEVRIVQTNSIVHFFVHIIITLKDEIQSKWEIDAWHPRVIDITTRPDGSIKNKKMLTYGTEVAIRYTISVNDFIVAPRLKLSVYENIEPPDPGPPEEDATPKRMVQEKYSYIYTDYTVEDSYAKNLLDKIDSDEIGYFRKMSPWQMKPNIIKKELEKKISTPPNGFCSSFFSLAPRPVSSDLKEVKKDAKKTTDLRTNPNSLALVPFSLLKKKNSLQKEMNTEKRKHTEHRQVNVRVAPY